MTPTELLRYENQEYLLEEIREESLPPSKPRGRPRKLDATITDASERRSVVPALRRPGQVAVVIPVTPRKSNKVPTHIPTAARLHRISVPMPFINRCQSAATGHSTSKGTRPERIAGAVIPVADIPSSEDDLGIQKQSRPQYSMVTASRLARSDPETSQDGETSTDAPVSRAESCDPISLERGPDPKRRKLVASHHIHLSLDGADRSRPRVSSAVGRSQGDPYLEDVEPVDTQDVRDEEEEREALLRQFQPSNLARRHISTISSSHSPTFTRGSSSPILPTIESTTPRKKSRKRSSLTPHFPPGARFTSSIFKHLSPTKEINPKNFQKSTPRSRPKTNAPAPHTNLVTGHRRALPLHSYNLLKSLPKSLTVGSSNLGSSRLEDLGPTADISNYFRPKSSIKAPLAAIVGSGSESEDPLTRGSSSDSLHSKIIVVQERSEATIPPTHETVYDSDDDSESVHSEFPIIQRRGQQQRQSPGRKTGTKRYSSDVPDTDDEYGPRRRAKRANPAQPNVSLSRMFHDSIARDMDQVEDDDGSDE